MVLEGQGCVVRLAGLYHAQVSLLSCSDPHWTLLMVDSPTLAGLGHLKTANDISRSCWQKYSCLMSSYYLPLSSRPQMRLMITAEPVLHGRHAMSRLQCCWVGDK